MEVSEWFTRILYNSGIVPQGVLLLMTNSILVSVIMPCYNKAQYIIEGLESVKLQTFSNWECIIVNDGSTDDSQKLIESYIGNDERFKLINIRNSGVCVARNIAVASSQGTYIYPLDPDDRIEPMCLEICINEFKNDPNLKLVCPQGRLFGSETGLWNLPEFDYKTMLKFNMIHNSSLFLRRDFESVGGYRSNMVSGFEDWDFFIALLNGCENRQVVKIKEPLFNYRVNHSGRRLLNAASKQQEDMLDLLVYNNFAIYKKYFPNIFSRVLEYDFDKVILSKGIVKFVTNALIKISELKRKFLKNGNTLEV